MSDQAVCESVQFDQLGEAADAMILEFLQDWSMAAVAAFLKSTRPSDPRSQGYWEWTLIGNLRWAACGFAMGRATASLMVITTGMAILGAGAADKVVHHSPEALPPDPSGIISNRVAQLGDALESDLLRMRRKHSWELHLDLFDLENADEHHQARAYVWERLIFPTTRYTDRREGLRTLMISNIESQLASYDQQWRQWYEWNVSYLTDTPATKTSERDHWSAPERFAINDRHLLAYRPQLFFDLNILE